MNKNYEYFVTMDEDNKELIQKAGAETELVYTASRADCMDLTETCTTGMFT